MAKIKLKPIEKTVVSFRIAGTSTLVQHKWSEKAKEMMRAKHAGRKAKVREKRDPEEEFREATYRTEDGRYGIPGMAFKSALIEVAHNDFGVPKTLVRKSVFLLTRDQNLIIPMNCSEPRMVEDLVRVGAGQADLRYRPYFDDWSVDIQLEVDSQMLDQQTLMTLVDRAGYGVGIGEMRPEKGGEYGRFEIDAGTPITAEVV